MIDFNPIDWIRSFIAVGGTIYLSADGVRIGYAPENEAATEAVRAIGREPENWRLSSRYSLGRLVHDPLSPELCRADLRAEAAEA